MGEKRRGIRICATVLLSAALALQGLSVEAAPYTYRVRIHAGVQGTFLDGSTVKEYQGDENGTVTVQVGSWEDEVELPEDSRYYVKGIKKSGTEEMGTASFTVGEDQDYVVVYGIKGERVGYTVTYKDEAGNELAPEKKYQGNIGDRPIVGYLPIDGYVPKNAYNLTRTLQENEAENVFPFVYERVETPVSGGRNTYSEEVEESTATQTVVVPGGGTAGGAEEQTADPAAGTTVIEGTAPEGAGGAQTGEEETAGEAQGQEDQGQEEGPQELVNLDDEEVPLAGPGSGSKPSGTGGGSGLLELPYGAFAGLLSAAVLAAAGIYFLITRRKKKAPEQEEE